MWWPNGYGEQHLYTLNVTFSSARVSENSTKKFKVGFRTVELVEDEIGKHKTDNTFSSISAA